MRKKGEIKKIKNGTWMLRVSTNRNGVRKSESKRYKSKEEAETALALILEEKKSVKPSPQTVTFNKLAESFLKFTYPTVAEQTFYTYEGYFNSHLKPRFGEILLSEITTYKIAEFYAELQLTLTGVTIVKIHTIFKAALKKAVEWGWLEKSPMEFVKAPSKTTRPKLSKRRNDKRHTLTPEEIDRFIDACGDLRTKCLWLFFAYSGARASEVLAARWKDLDFNENIFHLTQKLVQKKGRTRFDKTKTEKSERDIPLPPDFMHALKKLKVAQNIIRLKSEYWEDHDLVFTSRTGKPLQITNLGSKCYDILDKAEIKKHVTPHMFRHSFATNGLKNGGNIKFISEFLGHSSVKITMDVYSHVDIEDKRELSNLMSGLIKVKIA